MADTTTNLSILLLNGPNLNMLGTREPEHYGSKTLAQVVEDLTAIAQSLNVNLVQVQSNAEHVLIETLHQAMNKFDFVIINPAGFTHSSVALRDAILAVQIPFIEVHLSNIHAREAFRQHSYFSDKAEGVITGLGVDGYEYALRTAVKTLTSAAR